MGLRLAYYYSGFITGCVNIFLSTVLLFTINSPQPDKDKLFLPYYIFLKMQLALPIFELILSFTSQRIDPTLVVVASMCGRVPILLSVVRPEYSVFTLVLGILYGLGDVLKSTHAADKIDVGTSSRIIAWVRYCTPMWFYPVTSLCGELPVLIHHIHSLPPYTMERGFWTQFSLMYYSLFPLLYFVHCLLYYRNVNRPKIYAEHLAAYNAYLQKQKEKSSTADE
ncbi:Hypothetical protein DHA2_15461 [Giardia duodenalis]|uniref:Uncharacterized protein n=1 Tax=Giardia intestinalis TaxID=5741 RepID=V6T8W3_GIAIN|nr:Hypothetical protein DHA2_15461 [Giardia intestinalis]